MKLIHIINGPNLASLGMREPEIYGSRSFETYLEDLRHLYPDASIDYYQSNHEGELIDALYRAEQVGASGVVLNAGGYTHTSVALLDAIRAVSIPVVEVHISSIFAREDYRRQSVIAPACRGIISGFGLESYRLAVDFLVRE